MSTDVSRNIFIAVGSTAVAGLIHLLGRLKEDGIYDQKRDDIFIGMDSDCSRLQALKDIDLDSNPVRIHTVQLTLPNSSPEKTVVTRFEPEWKNMGGITASGVGGDRRLSFTTLNWKCFWDDIGIDKLLSKGDRVILLGIWLNLSKCGLRQRLSHFQKGPRGLSNFLVCFSCRRKILKILMNILFTEIYALSFRICS